MNFDLMSFCFGVMVGDTIACVAFMILSHLDK